MKYRKKPVVVEAITFDELVAHGRSQSVPLHQPQCTALSRPAGAPPIHEAEWIPWSFVYAGHPITHETDDCYLIPTLEGTMRFERGDFLITGVAGEIYPCKPAIFRATYEPVPEEP